MNREFDDGYSYIIKSRLLKKLNQFANQELPLLIERGYLTEFCKLTDSCKVRQGEGSSLVRILPPTSEDSLEISDEHGGEDKRLDKKKWAGSDSNQRSPPCQGGILTRLDHRPDIR